MSMWQNAENNGCFRQKFKQFVIPIIGVQVPCTRIAHPALPRPAAGKPEAQQKPGKPVQSGFDAAGQTP